MVTVETQTQIDSKFFRRLEVKHAIWEVNAFRNTFGPENMSKETWDESTRHLAELEERYAELKQ